MKHIYQLLITFILLYILIKAIIIFWPLLLIILLLEMIITDIGDRDKDIE